MRSAENTDDRPVRIRIQEDDLFEKVEYKAT
jgi:hypothetical protein